jgi:hypothetical protein
VAGEPATDERRKKEEKEKKTPMTCSVTHHHDAAPLASASVDTVFCRESVRPGRDARFARLVRGQLILLNIDMGLFLERTRHLHDPVWRRVAHSPAAMKNGRRIAG